MLQAIAFFSYIIYCPIVVPPFFSPTPDSSSFLRPTAAQGTSVARSFSPSSFVLLAAPSSASAPFLPTCTSAARVPSSRCRNVPRSVQEAEGLNYDEYPFGPLHAFPSTPLPPILPFFSLRSTFSPAAFSSPFFPTLPSRPSLLALSRSFPPPPSSARGHDAFIALLRWSSLRVVQLGMRSSQNAA